MYDFVLHVILPSNYSHIYFSFFVGFLDSFLPCRWCGIFSRLSLSQIPLWGKELMYGKNRCGVQQLNVVSTRVPERQI